MDPTAMTALVRDGWLDAELAGLLWLLAEARTPVLIVGPDEDARDRFLNALDALLPDAPRATVHPDDDFEWLREAVELGWRRERVGERPVPLDALSSSDGVLVARGLADAAGIAGARARIVVRALALGYGLLATMRGAGLDEAFAALEDPAVGTDEDERSRLGTVVVLGHEATAPRVVAAHYVRPVAVDPHGHVQREPPAVLATWNPTRGGWDHFAWGVLTELAGPVGMTAMQLEGEQARRASTLAQATRASPADAANRGV